MQSLDGIDNPKMKLLASLHTLVMFQTCMTFFLLQDTKGGRMTASVAIHIYCMEKAMKVNGDWAGHWA